MDVLARIVNNAFLCKLANYFYLGIKIILSTSRLTIPSFPRWSNYFLKSKSHSYREHKSKIALWDFNFHTLLCVAWRRELKHCRWAKVIEIALCKRKIFAVGHLPNFFAWIWSENFGQMATSTISTYEKSAPRNFKCVT